MKIHYNKEFNCFETTECHKTDNIELDGVQLIPITELEKIKAEVDKKYDELYVIDEFTDGKADSYVELFEIIDKHISELKGEQE